MVRKIASGSALVLVLGMLAFGASRGCSPAADVNHDTQGVAVPTDAGDPPLPHDPMMPPVTPTLPTLPTHPTMPPVMPVVPPRTAPEMAPPMAPAFPVIIASDVPAPEPIRTMPSAPTTDPPPPPEGVR